MPKMLLRQMLLRSPSTRREWIEITIGGAQKDWSKVSLHTEGVD